jgi:Cellulase (glycosyl hydrolase family 5)
MRLTRRGVLLGAGASAATGASASASDTPLRLHRGVNAWPWFALTREFPAPRTDYDWPPFQQDRPVPRADDLRRLQRAGFDFLRVPVDPGPFLSFTGARRAALMSLLRDAVTRTLGAGLNVVLNIQANDATHFWNSQAMVTSQEAPAFEPYRRFVADAASLLAAFPQQRVALEPVNEPPQSCASADWNSVQHALLAAARAQAPRLTLVATGGCGSMVSGLEALDPAAIGVPGPLLYTFHFYEPYLFSHQGAPWMREPVYKSLNAVPWPASAGSLDATLAAVRRRMAEDDARSPAEKEAAYAETEKVLRVYFDAQPARAFIDGYLAKAQAWTARHGIQSSQVLLGEFGALRTDQTYVAAGAADRARYVRDVREAAEACGFPWAFWDLFGGMGVMDDSTRTLDPAIIASLGLRVA